MELETDVRTSGMPAPKDRLSVDDKSLMVSEQQKENLRFSYGNGRWTKLNRMACRERGRESDFYKDLLPRSLEEVPGLCADRMMAAPGRRVGDA